MEAVEVLPISDLEALAQELAERAQQSTGSEHAVGKSEAFHEAAQLVRAKIEEGGGVSVIPCAWLDPDGSSAKVGNDCFVAHEGQCVVEASDQEEGAVVGLTAAQAREMASALMVYAFFVERDNARLTDKGRKALEEGKARG